MPGLFDDAYGPSGNSGAAPAQATPKGGLFDDVYGPAPTAAPPAAPDIQTPGVTAPGHATRYKKAAMPPPAPVKGAPPQADIDAPTALKLAWQNAPSSAMETLRAMGNAVTHPIKTLGSLGQVGAGALDSMGVQLGPTAMTAQERAPWQAVSKHYGDIYGPLLQGKTQPFARAFATDPVGTAMDVSTAVGVPGGALKGAGAVAKIAGAGKLAEGLGAAGDIASGVSKAIDPVEWGIKAGQGATGLAGGLVRGAHSIPTGINPDLFKASSDAGANLFAKPGDIVNNLKSASGVGDVLKAPFSGKARAFTSGLMGAPASEQAMRIKNAVGDIKNKQFVDQQAAKSGLQGVQPSYQPVYDAIDAARQKLSPGGVRTGLFDLAHQHLDDLEQAVQSHEAARNLTDPATGLPQYPELQGLGGMDNLRAGIYDAAQGTSNQAANGAMMSAYHGAKQSLTDAFPGYQDLVENTKMSMDHINDLTKELGAGHGSASATSRLRKALKSSKTESGKSLLDEVNKQDPTIMPGLAGHAAQDWGTHNLLNGILASAVPGLGLAPFIVSSPKLAGAAHFAAGMAGGATSAAARAARLPYYGARTDELTHQDIPDTPPPSSLATPDQINAGILKSEGTGRNPNSSATGPGQFTTPTFIDSVKKYHPEVAAGKSDAEIAALHGTPQGDQLQLDMTPKLDNDNAKTIQAMGIQPTPGRIKLAHMLGHAGMKRFFSADPNTPAERVISPQAIGANASLFAGRTVGDIEQWAENEMQRRMGRASGGRVDDEKHEYLVNKLMRLAKDAKTAADSVTEPLLKAPDEAVVKALEVAQKAI
jgi:hypothetical protein